LRGCTVPVYASAVKPCVDGIGVKGGCWQVAGRGKTVCRMLPLLLLPRVLPSDRSADLLLEPRFSSDFQR
jgi:hypothetical protein